MTWRDDFWGSVYDHRQHLWLLMMFLLFLFILTAMSFALGHQRETSRVIAYLNTLLILGTAGIAAALYWYSSKRNEKY